MRRIPQIVADELDACGLPWRLVDGGRHYKLIVGDRLTGILPKARVSDHIGAKQRAFNIRAQIRRAAKAQS